MHGEKQKLRKGAVPWLVCGLQLLLVFHSRSRVVRFFPQQQNFAMGSLAQISSCAIRCSFNTRFRRVLVQILYLVRFRRVPVKMPAEAPKGSVWFRRVPEGSGADTL